MTEYSSQTVAQLKEILKQRGLPTNGVKNDLIARLEESDKPETTDEKAGETKVPEAEAEEELLEEVEVDVEAKPKEADQEKEESSNNVEENTPKDSEEPKQKAVKELTPEERKAAAIELLNKKIARAKKFGTEDDVESIKKDLARVEKFGVAAGTTLAREIGLSNADTLHEHGGRDKHFRGRHHGGRRGREFRRH